LIVSNEAELPQPRQVPPALSALAAPQSGMERQAKVGGAKLAFLIAFACSLLTAFAQASRIDARSATLQKLEKAGTLQTMSEKQLDDEVKNAERLAEVGRVAWGVVEAPVFLLLGALAVVILIWFARGKVKARAVFPIAAAALLPGAVANLLDAITALERNSLPVTGATLAPRNLSDVLSVFGHTLQAPWVKLGNAFDFFSLWAAFMLAYGIAAAGDVPPRRALVFTLVGWVSWRLLTNVAMGG